MQYQTVRKKKRPADATEKNAVLQATTVRRQLARAAGHARFPNRDPIYQVSEDFQENFDLIGQRHAALLIGETGSGFSRSEETPVTEAESASQAERDAFGQERQPDYPDRTSAGKLYQMRDPAHQQMIRRFSELAFRRGTMAGAVLGGTGKMMLVSCLKRAAGLPRPVQQQRRLFEGSAQQCNVPGHSPDQVVFHRGFVAGAVGLVVDTLQDARQTVDSLAALASGKGPIRRGEGALTLRKLYPFLDDSQERELLQQYQARLRETGETEEKALLQNACVRAQALIGKKAQMRNGFVNKLRLIADRATEALTLFDTPAFADEVLREVISPAAPPEPPPALPSASSGREEDDDNAADRTEP